MTNSACEKTETPEARRVDVPEVQPATDIYEREDAYVVVADMPGVDQQGLDLSVEERVLTVDGLAEVPGPASATLLHREFGAVRYHRAFRLSDDIDVEKISAAVKNGVLRLTLPKLPQRQPRKIPVTAG